MRPLKATATALTASVLAAACFTAGSASADDPGGGVDPGTPLPGQSVGWVTATDGEITLRATINAIGGKSHAVTGRAGNRRTRIVLERQVSAGSWQALNYANTSSNGSYAIAWRVAVFGRFNLRVRGAGLAGAPSALISAFHPARATVFGAPGEYPQGLAGGGTLGATTLGVAHLTLPFRTQVQIAYGTRSMVLPVIDRGPYRRGYQFDVTYTAATWLKMDGLSSIGYLIIGKDPGT